MPSLTHPIPDQLLEVIARRFRVMGEPARLRLLDLLRHEEATVNELVERTGMTQQNVSKHLGVLHREGILARTKEGTSVRYAIADEAVFAICEQVCGSLERDAAGLQDLINGGTR